MLAGRRGREMNERRKIKRSSVEIDHIAGEPRDKSAGAFIRAKVTVHFEDERELGSTVTVELFAPFDTDATLSGLRERIMVEADAVIAQARELLKSGR